MPITRNELLAERQLRYRVEEQLERARAEVNRLTRMISESAERDDLDAYLAEQARNPSFAAAYERARLCAALRQRAVALRREGLDAEAEANETAAELIQRREI